jgi:hypothetical protein
MLHELHQRCDLQTRGIPFFFQDFVDHEDRYRDVQLPLPARLG